MDTGGEDNASPSSSPTSRVKKAISKMINNDVKISEYKFRKVVFQFYAVLLEKAIQKNPKSLRLKFIQMSLLKTELDNEFKSFFTIMKILKESPTFDWQFYLYQSKKRVERIMYKKYQSLLNSKQSLDVIKVFDFEIMFKSFESQIKQTAHNCLNFW